MTAESDRTTDRPSGADPADGSAPAPLVECPRCKGFSRSPDDHILGPAYAWKGGKTPFPPMRYCTTRGVIRRAISTLSEPDDRELR